MKWENGGSTVKFYDWASERKDLITWRKLEKEQGRGSFGVLCRRWVLYFLVLMLISQIIIQVWNSEERSGLELYFLESSLYTSIYETRQQMIPAAYHYLSQLSTDRVESYISILFLQYCQQQGRAAGHPPKCALSQLLILGITKITMVIMVRQRLKWLKIIGNAGIFRTPLFWQQSC